MNAFLPIGITFFVLGVGLSVGRGIEQGVAFLVLGFTFFILSQTDSDDDENSEDGDGSSERE